jgi:hypothetical protein
MRTVLASLALAFADSTQSAWAHEGHGASAEHLHGADWLVWIGAAVVVGLWLLRRRGR